jgi:hypothetical protein
MKHALIFVLASVLAAGVAWGGEKKPLPNQAGNDDIDLAGTLLLDHDDCTKALGADLGPHYVIVKIRIIPKIDVPVHVSADDFTLISRKDGERSPALSPFQIAGRGTIVLKPAGSQPGGLGTVSNGPVWGGIGGASPRQMPGNGGGMGNGGAAERGTVDAAVDTEKNAKENPLLGILKQKNLPDKDIKEPIEGLLFFALDGKLKPKDVTLMYKGAAGRLMMDFSK